MKNNAKLKSGGSDNPFGNNLVDDSHNKNLHPIIVGTGLISLDAVFGVDNNSEPKYWAGGTCGNVLSILSYLGWNSYPIGIIGQDNASKLAILDMKQVGVKTKFLEQDNSFDTPIVVEQIKNNAKGEARHSFMWTCPNCGAKLPLYRTVPINRARVLVDQLPVSSVFFFDRVSRGILHMAEAYAAQGSLIVFEPSGVKEAKLFQEAVSLSHIVKYSHQRMSRLNLPAYPVPSLEIETMGASGLRYRTSSGISYSTKHWIEMKAYAVDSVRDTAGAGDWCTSAIINSLGSRGAEGLKTATERDVVQALKIGQGFSAIKCHYEGARGVMYALLRKELETRVRQIVIHKKTPLFAGNKKQQLSESLRGICPKCSEIKPQNVNVR